MSCPLSNPIAQIGCHEPACIRPGLSRQPVLWVIHGCGGGTGLWQSRALGWAARTAGLRDLRSWWPPPEVCCEGNGLEIIRRRKKTLVHRK